MNDIIMYNVVFQTKVRKNKVDIPKLQQCLKAHRHCSIKEIAKQLNVPTTQVEHYFRTDIYFAIPEPNIWYSLKKILNITTNEFDESIMTFIV